MLTIEYLRECFDYNADTGVLTWKHRPLDHFKNATAWKAWLSRFPGQTAGFPQGHGHLGVTIGGVRYLVHRLVWALHNGSYPDREIDHINGVKADNRISNLREVSRSDNMRNKSARANSATGVYGVTWHKHKQKWAASIGVDRKMVTLGYFDIFSEAVECRKKAEALFGYHPNHGRSA